MSAYQLYRETTLGTTLTATLDEFIEDGRISKELALRVLQQFDRTINASLAYRTNQKVTFKGEQLQTYRYTDNVWTFVVDNMEVRDMHRTMDVGILDRVKIVACDGTVPRMK